MLEHKIKYKYMRRELEEELKNECFLSQMKSKRLKDMEDFFDNDDWCYEKDENEKMRRRESEILNGPFFWMSLHVY